jgi:hypothetical protein
MALSITALSLMALKITTLSKTAYSLFELSNMGLRMTIFSITVKSKTQQSILVNVLTLSVTFVNCPLNFFMLINNAEFHYAE